MDSCARGESHEVKRSNFHSALLVLVKLIKVASIFLAYDILKDFHILPFLFFIKLICSVCFVLFQRPFIDNAYLSVVECLRVTRHGFIRVFLDIMWITGLILCGPFRFILLYGHSDIVIVCLLSTIIVRSISPSKSRGAAFFILGLVSIIFFDHDVTDQNDDHPEGVHKSLLIHRIYELFIYCGLSDHKAGALFLILASCLEAGFSSFARGLAATIGGAKRLHALSTVASTVIIFILLIVRYICGFVFPIGERNDIENYAWTYIHWLKLTWICIIAFVFVAEFYGENFLNSKLGSSLSSKISYLTCVFTALALHLYINRAPVLYPDLDSGHISSNDAFIIRATDLPLHLISTGVIIGMISLLYASSLLSAPNVRNPGKYSSRHFLGFSAAGLPLYTPQPYLSPIENNYGIQYHAGAIMGQVFADRSSFMIFVFLCLNLSFTFVELFYGVWTNSLGLISDGFHMLFDCAALVMGLYASVIGRWKPTCIFSYGFHRVEVLSGFINSLALLVISVSIAINAFARIHQPPDINTDRLMAVSIGGLLVNLVGVMALGHTHSHGGSHGHSHGSGSSHAHSHAHNHTHEHSHNHVIGCNDHAQKPCSGKMNQNSNGVTNSAYGHSHDSTCVSNLPGGLHAKHKQDEHACEDVGDSSAASNLKGVYLHVLADTLGSVGVIISSYFVTNYGWNIADPICSLFISAAIAYSALPLVEETISILALRAPSRGNLAHPDFVIEKILQLNFVLEVLNPCIWSNTVDGICCSVRVRLADQIDEQLALIQIKEVLKNSRISHLTIQLEKSSLLQYTESLGLRMESFRTFSRTDVMNSNPGSNNFSTYNSLSNYKDSAWTSISF